MIAENDRMRFCPASPGAQLSGEALPAWLGRRPGLSARQPLFGGPGAPSDQLQINIESGTVDLDDEIDQLRHSVGRLKQVGGSSKPAALQRRRLAVLLTHIAPPVPARCRRQSARRIG